MITIYQYSDFKDYEEYDEFLNELFAGLKYYQKQDPKFTFKLKYNDKVITLTTLKLEHGLN